AAFASGGVFARIDPQWMRLMEDRIPFLFSSMWSFQDWIRTLVPLTLLIIGALVCERPEVRKFSVAALLTGSLGLLITAIGVDWLNLVSVTRIQPWRWLWIAQ